jgi:DNA-binding IclR family transcriptional regulator
MALVKAKSTQAYKLNSVVEALTIFAIILDAKDSLGLGHLCKYTHFTKNKTFRLLTTLEQCGLVDKDQQKNYSLGITSIGIARKILAKTSVVDNVRPYMEELVKIINEAVYFAHCADGEAVLVDYVDCCHSVKATSFVGTAIQLPDSTKPIISDNRVAKIGDISVDVDKIGLGISTVSMPFVNERGVEIGALVVLAPNFRMSKDRIKTEVVPALREVMQRKPLQFTKIMKRFA